MVTKYFLNLREQPEGEHEVHTANCRYCPSEQNAEYLGTYANSAPAVLWAQMVHPSWSINGCAHCCPETDTD